MSRPLQEEDSVPTGKLLAGLALTVAVTLGSVLLVRLETPRPAPRPAPAVAIYGDVPADLPRLTRQRLRLERYQRLDPRRDVIQIPIARAMELIAAGAEP